MTFDEANKKAQGVSTTTTVKPLVPTKSAWDIANEKAKASIAPKPLPDPSTITPVSPVLPVANKGLGAPSASQKPQETSASLPSITSGNTTQMIGPEGKGLGDIAYDVIKNPIVSLGAVERGTTNFIFNVGKSVAKAVGADSASKYISDNQQAMNEIAASNLKGKDEETAAAIGEFVGGQVPYFLAGAGLESVGTKVAASLVDGATTLKTAETIGNLTKIASNVAGFSGLSQLTYDKEQGSRWDVLKKDIILLGAFESLGAGMKAYSNLKSTAEARSFLETLSASKEKPSLDTLENTVKTLLANITTETRKTPESIVAEAVATGDTKRINGAIDYLKGIKTKAQLQKEMDALDNLIEESRAFNEGGKTPGEAKIRAKQEKRLAELDMKASGNKITGTEGKFLTQAEINERNALKDAIEKPIPVVKAEKPDVTKVPGSQLPVGEGKVQASRLEARMKKSLDSFDESNKKNLATFGQMNKKDQLEKASRWVGERTDQEVLDVLEGRREPPEGILHNSIYLAMQERLKMSNNADLATKLASLRSSRAGQEISILTEADKNGPVRFLKELRAKKIAAIGGEEKMTRAIKSEVEKAGRIIEKVKPTKDEWVDFLKEIKC